MRKVGKAHLDFCTATAEFSLNKCGPEWHVEWNINAADSYFPNEQCVTSATKTMELKRLKMFPN